MVISIPGHSGTLDVVKENKRLTRCFLFYAVSRTQSPTNTRLTVFYSANLVTTHNSHGQVGDRYDQHDLNPRPSLAWVTGVESVCDCRLLQGHVLRLRRTHIKAVGTERSKTTVGSVNR